jgi:uncharacterized protein
MRKSQALANIVVADSSPLIGLGRINQLPILNSVFDKIIIPSKVAEECLLDSSRSGAKAIQNAISHNFIEINSQRENADSIEKLAGLLDEGEAAAIMLAQKLKAPILIDEKLGRRVAREIGLQIIGVGAVLVIAKRKGAISNIQLLINQLKDSGFRLSEQLIKRILLLAGET